MDLKEAQAIVDDLEPKIERLKALYQQYFMGIEKIPPHVLRKDVDRQIFRIRRSKLQNTRLRFKFQQLVQRYNTYDQYWGRILRQIEKGTYKRDLRKAAKRFGADEVRAIGGRQAEAALHGLEDEVEERPGREQPVYELPDPDNFEIDLGFDEDDMPTPPSRRAPRHQSYSAMEVWDPGDLYPSQPPADQAPGFPTAPVDAGLIPAPRPTRPGYPPPPAEQARRGPRGNYPSQHPPVPNTMSQPLPQPGASRYPPAPATGPLAPAPPPSSPGVPAPAHGYPAAGYPAPPTGGAPMGGAPADGVPPARESRPQGGALFGAKRRAIPPATPSPAPNRPAPKRGPAGPPPAAPGQRRPLRPPPKAPARPGQAPSRPPPPAPKRAARPRPKAQGGDDRTRAVYDEYVRARKRTGQGGNVSYDALRKSLEKQADQLRKRHGSNRKVDFEVVEKDGKPLIRPVVK